MYLNTLMKSSSIAVCLALSACGSDTDEVIEKEEAVVVGGTIEDPGEPHEQINPSQGQIYGPFITVSDEIPEFIYVDLDTLNVVEISEAPEDNSQWDIAFKGADIHLNQHADNVVSVYALGNNSDFFDEDGVAIKDSFINTTAELEQDDYLAITTDHAPSEDVGYVPDKTLNILEGFYYQNPITNVITPEDENYFIVHSDGEFTKFNVTDMTTYGNYITSITFDISHQGVSYLRFPPERTLTVDTALSCSEDAIDVYIDFKYKEEVDSSDDWDIRLPCNAIEQMAELAMHLPDDAQAIQDFDDEYTAITPSEIASYGFKSDEYIIKAFDSLAWYQRNLKDEALLWSQFDIYLIKTPTVTYKFQITDYYDWEGNPGHISFRTDELSDLEGIKIHH